MTPLEVLQRKVTEASEAGVFNAFARNCLITVLILFGVAAILVGGFLLANILYWVIGGWGFAISLILTVGVLVAAIVTALELA